MKWDLKFVTLSFQNYNYIENEMRFDVRYFVFSKLQLHLEWNEIWRSLLCLFKITITLRMKWDLTFVTLSFQNYNYIKNVMRLEVCYSESFKWSIFVLDKDSNSKLLPTKRLNTVTKYK
jgi:hypothetical protein